MPFVENLLLESVYLFIYFYRIFTEIEMTQNENFGRHFEAVFFFWGGIFFSFEYGCFWCINISVVVITKFRQENGFPTGVPWCSSPWVPTGGVPKLSTIFSLVYVTKQLKTKKIERHNFLCFLLLY